MGKGFDARDAHLKQHRQLLAIMRRLPEDYQPYGVIDRNALDRAPDCSMGCKHALELPDPLGADWVVCTNEKSHRCGLLTFEHQGCPQFESGPSRFTTSTTEDYHGKETSGGAQEASIQKGRRPRGLNQEDTAAEEEVRAAPGYRFRILDFTDSGFLAFENDGETLTIGAVRTEGMRQRAWIVRCPQCGRWYAAYFRDGPLELSQNSDVPTEVPIEEGRRIILEELTCTCGARGLKSRRPVTPPP